MTVRVTRRSGTGSNLEIDLADGGGGDPWDAVIKVEWRPGLATAGGAKPDGAVVDNEEGYVLWRNVTPDADGTKDVRLKFRFADGLATLALAITILDVPNAHRIEIPFAVTPD